MGFGNEELEALFSVNKYFDFVIIASLELNYNNVDKYLEDFNKVVNARYKELADNDYYRDFKKIKSEIPYYKKFLNLYNSQDTISKVLELISKVDLVIWDDIATDYLTPYEHGMLLSYIDQRNLSDKSNIFTGNVKPDMLVSKVGERLSSRIKSGILIELKGGDARNGSAPDFK